MSSVCITRLLDSVLRVGVRGSPFPALVLGRVTGKCEHPGGVGRYLAAAASHGLLGSWSVGIQKSKLPMKSGSQVTPCAQQTTHNMIPGPLQSSRLRQAPYHLKTPVANVPQCLAYSGTVLTASHGGPHINVTTAHLGTWRGGEPRGPRFSSA